MDKEYEIKFHDLEEKHWWFQARRDAILKLVDGFDKNSRILDVGCAGGPLIHQLLKDGFKNVYGIDFSPKAVYLCKQCNLQNIFLMDAQEPSFEDDTFDLIIASDSLEHLEYDEKALTQWRRILKPKGTLILFVPAHRFLWSSHDNANHHYRRYSRADLSRKLKKAGFHICKISFWNFILFFPIAAIRIFQKIFINRKDVQNGQLKMPNHFLNQQLIFLLKLENQIFKLVGLPIGVSLFALATNSEK